MPPVSYATVDALDTEAVPNVSYAASVDVASADTAYNAPHTEAATVVSNTIRSDAISAHTTSAASITDARCHIYVSADVITRARCHGCPQRQHPRRTGDHIKNILLAVACDRQHLPRWPPKLTTLLMLFLLLSP